MKKEIGILMISIALVMLFSACEGGNNSNPDKETPYIGGQSGLSVQFVDDAPPPEVFDMGQYPFNIEVKLLNNGEADIAKENVKISISGLNPADFEKTEAFFIKDGIDEDILATYKDYEGNIIKATDVIVVFPGLNFKDTLSGNFNTNVRADVCYTYRTDAVSKGCIKPNPLREESTDICTVKEKKTIYNSGAPIQVESFEEMPSGTDKVRYLFTIKHVGTGKVYAPQSKCPSSREALNKIHFKLEFPAEQNNLDFECAGLVNGVSKEGDVILRDGTAVVRCTQVQASSIVFDQRIQVKLDYDYLETYDAPILVKKSN
jgi:hypothetical protein